MEEMERLLREAQAEKHRLLEHRVMKRPHKPTTSCYSWHQVHNPGFQHNINPHELHLASRILNRKLVCSVRSFPFSHEQQQIQLNAGTLWESSCSSCFWCCSWEFVLEQRVLIVCSFKKKLVSVRIYAVQCYLCFRRERWRARAGPLKRRGDGEKS